MQVLCMGKSPEFPAGKRFGDGKIYQYLTFFVGLKLGVKECGFGEVGAEGDGVLGNVILDVFTIYSYTYRCCFVFNGVLCYMTV